MGPAKKVEITYDQVLHCVAVQERHGKSIAVDALPHCGGKGEEFSPDELVTIGLGCCMVLSMGVAAKGLKADLRGTRIQGEVSMSEGQPKRIGTINLVFMMPRKFSAEDRERLQKAVAMCPLTHSFHPETAISVNYVYPEQ